MIFLKEPSLEQIYKGKCGLLNSNQVSENLTQVIKRKAQDHFQCQDLKKLHLTKSNDGIQNSLGSLRKTLHSLPFQSLQKQLLDSLNMPQLSKNIRFDHLRLRVIRPDSHLLKAAAPAFSAHRDTWYANPQNQINIWIPLFDYQATQTFVFYPEYFNVPVPNDSHIFNYQEWKEKVGWQGDKNKSSENYPQALIPLNEGIGFQPNASQILLFSGHHLHQPLPNISEETRWSIDFRVVSLADEILKKGPLNIDNKAKGSTLSDYIHLP